MKTIKFFRYLFVAACSTAVFASASSFALAAKQEAKFPERDIELVVGYSPGGGYSNWAQALAPVLEKHLGNGTNVLVRNMPGAGGVVATNYLYQAEPDGHTIGIVNLGGMAATQAASEVRYDLREMTWLGRLSLDPAILVAGPHSGINQAEDLRGRENTVVSTKGLAANATIAGAVTLDLLGVDWRALNHKGTSEMILSIIRGDSDIGWGSIDSLKQYLENGDLKMILYYDAERNADYPNVPTPSDIGLPEEVNEAFNTNRLIGAPPGLPKNVRKTLEEAIAKAVVDPKFLERLEKMEVSAQYLNGEATAKIVSNAVKGFTKYSDTISDLLSDK